MKSVFLNVILAILVFTATSVSAQEVTEVPVYQPKFSNEELFGFFDSNQKISVIQRNGNEEINQMLAEKGLTLQRFQEISKAQETGILTSFSEAEIEAFNAIGPTVSQKQIQIQEQVQAAMAEHNLTNDKYLEILNEYRADAELQQYVKGILRERAKERARAEKEAKAKEAQQN